MSSASLRNPFSPSQAHWPVYFSRRFASLRASGVRLGALQAKLHCERVLETTGAARADESIAGGWSDGDVTSYATNLPKCERLEKQPSLAKLDYASTPQ